MNWYSVKLFFVGAALCVPVCTRASEQTAVTTTASGRYNPLTDGKEGRTVLHCAARGGDLSRVLQCLGQGADLKAVDASGKTPLDYARENGHGPMVDLLQRWPLCEQQATTNACMRSFLAGGHARCGGKSVVQDFSVNLRRKILALVGTYTPAGVFARPADRMQVLRARAERATTSGVLVDEQEIRRKKLFRDEVRRICGRFYYDQLRNAVQSGDDGAVERALVMRDVYQKSGLHADQTALFYALQKGNQPLMEKLWRLDEPNSHELGRALCATLESCVWERLPNVMSIAGQVEGVDGNIFNSVCYIGKMGQRSPLFAQPKLLAAAVACNNTALVEWLLQKVVVHGQNAEEFLCDTLYHYWLMDRERRQNSRPALELLLQACARARTQCPRTEPKEKGWEAQDYSISKATEENDIETVRLLLQHGFDPNVYPHLAMSPLQFSVEKGNDEFVRVLLDGGAKPDRWSGGASQSNIYSLPKLLVSQCKYDLLERVLANWPKEEEYGYWLCCQALDEAVQKHDLQSVKILLKWGWERTNKTGNVFDRKNSRLSAAIKAYDIDLMRLLLKYGANPNKGEFDFSSPLEVVAQCYNGQRNQKGGEADKSEAVYQMAQLLLQHGADVFRACENGSSYGNLLHLAQKKDDCRMCDLLFSHAGRVLTTTVSFWGRPYSEKMQQFIDNWPAVHETRVAARKAHVAFCTGLLDRCGKNSAVGRFLSHYLAWEICAYLVPGRTCTDWKKPVVVKSVEQALQDAPLTQATQVGAGTGNSSSTQSTASHVVEPGAPRVGGQASVQAAERGFGWFSRFASSWVAQRVSVCRRPVTMVTGTCAALLGGCARLLRTCVSAPSTWWGSVSSWFSGRSLRPLFNPLW